MTFINSRQRLKEYQRITPNSFEFKTTTLSKSDFFIREDTCNLPPYRLLYTGRIDRTKGLFELFEAVAILVKAGIDVTLDLVGWSKKNDPIVVELNEFAASLGIRDRIVFHGYKPLGPDLFIFYKQADVYIISSKSNPTKNSEGS